MQQTEGAAVVSDWKHLLMCNADKTSPQCSSTTIYTRSVKRTLTALSQAALKNPGSEEDGFTVRGHQWRAVREAQAISDLVRTNTPHIKKNHIYSPSSAIIRPEETVSDWSLVEMCCLRSDRLTGWQLLFKICSWKNVQLRVRRTCTWSTMAERTYTNNTYHIDS